MNKLTIEKLPVFVQRAITTMTLASNGRGQNSNDMKASVVAIRNYIVHCATNLVGQKNRVTGEIFTVDTAKEFVSARIVRAYEEEEKAVTTDSFSTWSTREDVGDAELCNITYIARNSLEYNDMAEYTYAGCDDEIIDDDGRDYVNTVDWAERKERESEMLDLMRSGKFSPQLILKRAYNLAKTEVISWKCYRVLRILAPAMALRNVNDNEGDFFC